MKREEVILVNEADIEIGTCEKLKAHEEGLLHRAFSVILYNSNGEMLLQQRAQSKYHSPGLWTNACCSHPAPGETALEAAHRRLKEEIGIEAQVDFDFKFIYRTVFDNGLTEHELDYVFIGQTDAVPVLNPQEAKSFKYLTIGQLYKEIEEFPERFTVWFKLIMDKIKERNGVELS